MLNSYISDVADPNSTQMKLEDFCKNSAVKPFLTTKSSNVFGKSVVTFHTAESASTSAERRKLQSLASHAGLAERIRVKAHSDKKIGKPRSFEQLLDLYDDGEIAYDPTGGFDRANKLLNFAQVVRGNLGNDKVAGVFWHAEWRTAYVVLNYNNYFNDKKVKVADLGEAEREARKAMALTCTNEFVSALRIGFELPALALTPIDNASRIEKSNFLGQLAKIAKVPAAAALGGAMLATPAAADGHGSMPAVSGINGKIAIIGGTSDGIKNTVIDTNAQPYSFNSDDNDIWLGVGSITVPLGERMGIQIDGVFGQIDHGPITNNGFGSASFGEQEVWGIGGHLFWRDPSQGLIGFTASHTDFSAPETNFTNGIITIPSGGAFNSSSFPGFDITRLGGEVEIYQDQFTLAARGGYERISYDYINTSGGFANANFLKDEIDGSYAGVDFNWYATDDFMVSLGASTSTLTDGFQTKAGFEWAPAMEGFEGLTIFADGIFGPDDSQTLLAGVRVYFGEGSTLKERHRYDDPETNEVYEAVIASKGFVHPGYGY